MWKKSKSKSRDTNDESGTSSEYDSNASLGSHRGKWEELSGLPDWALSRRANSHRKKIGGTQEWKDGALVKDTTVSTYSTSDVIPGDHLSPKMQAKILNGEFVDTFHLVPPSEELGRGEKRPSYSKRKGKYPRVPRTFGNWLDHFQAYMGTIVAAYPKRAVHLVAYLSNIRTAYSLSGEAATISYDKEFRRKASRIPDARWDQIENGIWSVEVGPYVEKKSQDFFWTGKSDPRKEENARYAGSITRGFATDNHVRTHTSAKDAQMPTQLLHAIKENSPFVGDGRPIKTVPEVPPQQGTRDRDLLGLAFLLIKLPPPLQSLLAYYPDRRAASYFWKGFPKGFRIPVTGSLTAKESPNQKSVRERTEVADKKIAKEVAVGRVAGPFLHTHPIQNLHLSSLGPR